MDNRARLWASFEPLTLTRIRPEHNERRFYALAMTVDLFGNIVLIRNWGRIGTSGRQREETHSNVTAAAENMERLMRKKCGRGYVDR